MSKISQFFIIATFALIADITICEGAVCTAGITGPDRVSGFDGGPPHHMATIDKYLASTYVGGTNTYQCKFKIVLNTEADGSGNPVIGWMVIAFGIHNKNTAKCERNFRVSQTQGLVTLRGRGLTPVPVNSGCYETGPFPRPWHFCVFPVPLGCWTITFGVIGSTCQGAVTYCEKGTVTNPSGNDQVTMSISSYYDGLLDGMCGDQNGNLNEPVCTPPTCVL